MAHFEIPPSEVWTKGTNCINGPSDIEFHPTGKAKAIADCLGNQFIPHDSREENHEKRMEARLQALLEAVNNSPLRELDHVTYRN
jgi:hypothetical protein